jgi:hypothetical protein
MSSLLTGLRGCWKLDESSGNAVDSSGNGYTLTNLNTVTYTSAKINNGASGGSSNTNKALVIDTNLPLGMSYAQFATAWTWAGWVNEITAVTSSQFMGMQVQSGSTQRRNVYIVSRSGGTSGPIAVAIFDGTNNTYTTSFSLTTGVPVFFVLSYTGTGFEMYINNSNVLSQSRAMSSSATANTGGFGLLTDRQGGAGFNWFSGWMDEVGVWDRVLTSDERTQLYNGGSGLSYPFATQNTGAFFSFF